LELGLDLGHLGQIAGRDINSASDKSATATADKRSSLGLPRRGDQAATLTWPASTERAIRRRRPRCLRRRSTRSGVRLCSPRCATPTRFSVLVQVNATLEVTTRRSARWACQQPPRAEPPAVPAACRPLELRHRAGPAASACRPLELRYRAGPASRRPRSCWRAHRSCILARSPAR
jgi:hypothetical protein